LYQFIATLAALKRAVWNGHYPDIHVLNGPNLTGLIPRRQLQSGELIAIGSIPCTNGCYYYSVLLTQALEHWQERTNKIPSGWRPDPANNKWS
jgi:hypothetical protein